MTAAGRSPWRATNSAKWSRSARTRPRTRRASSGPVEFRFWTTERKPRVVMIHIAARAGPRGLLRTPFALRTPSAASRRSRRRGGPPAGRPATRARPRTAPPGISAPTMTLRHHKEPREASRHSPRSLRRSTSRSSASTFPSPVPGENILTHSRAVQHADEHGGASESQWNVPVLGELEGWHCRLFRTVFQNQLPEPLTIVLAPDVS